jgi:hypothetical protein
VDAIVWKNKLPPDSGLNFSEKNDCTVSLIQSTVNLSLPLLNRLAFWIYLFIVYRPIATLSLALCVTSDDKMSNE